ncbi:MAG: glycosyl transferase [Arcobacter sp.]|uniref:glycosyl transferase n=1 Tax=Arcobacter sp. TaxID=1872629 RepID=UPI003AFF872E
MNFFKYIKAVGTGPKSNRELTQEEMKDCIRQILNQEVQSELIVAFLLGWRVRLETNAELKATLDVCNEYIKKVNIPNSIELGFPYDGKTDGTYLFPLVAKYLKKFDLDIVVSGDIMQPAKDGITVKDIATNIKLDDNIHYFDRKDFLPKLSAITDLRKLLQLRSAFNTVEKLLNPANSRFALTSAYHKPYVEKYSEIFASNYEKFVVVKAAEGRPELFAKSKAWLKTEDGLEEFIIDPEYYGINYNKTFENITLDEAIKEINNPSSELEKLAKLNAALHLFCANKADDIGSAYEMLD